MLIQTLTWWSPSDELLTMNYDRQTVDDRFSVQRGYQRERNLRIRNVRTDDAGLYTCKQSQHSALATAAVQLVVNGRLHRVGLYSSSLNRQMLASCQFLRLCLMTKSHRCI